MDRGTEERCTGASSCSIESDDSSIDCDLYGGNEVQRASWRCPSSSSLLQRRFSFLSCIMIFLVLGGGGIRNQAMGLAVGAGLRLPVTRSFSKMKGSGTAEGESGAMTAEHYRQLRDHDYKRSLSRHGRLLSTTVVDLPLHGNDYPTGLYYTEIGLGTPTNQYFVQVDTGSDLLWVNCKPCPGCPPKSRLPNVNLRLYDPGSSSTSSNTSCSDTLCASAENGLPNCLDNSCYYSSTYGDGSTTMGYLVQDTMTFDTGVKVNGKMSTASADVVFGCGFNQTGVTLTAPDQATDGIMGFGQAAVSVITQLASAKKTTNMFAHCLQGDNGDGGTFFIGEVNEPGIVYTPLISGQGHYNALIKSIALGGTTLNIPPSVFEITTVDTGTIFDSGTTLAYLVDDAFIAFEQKLVSLVPPYTYDTANGATDSPCYQDINNLPSVTLNFDGASMQLGPTNYMFQTQANPSLWCLRWSKSSDSGLDGLTILGDIVLKDKLVTYDLINSRIGWVNHHCTSSVNVSNGTAEEAPKQRRKRKRTYREDLLAKSGGANLVHHRWKLRALVLSPLVILADLLL